MLFPTTRFFDSIEEQHDHEHDNDATARGESHPGTKTFRYYSGIEIAQRCRSAKYKRINAHHSTSIFFACV